MAGKFSPVNVDQINFLAQPDFNDLRAFIIGLQDMPKVRPNSVEVISKLESVIATFQDVAQMYLEKAQEFLDKEEAQPRLLKNELVQTKVQNHALMLSELLGPDPDKAYFPVERRQLFHKLITFIARRISGQPYILPVLGNTFKYVHFNYIDGFGLLCLPPRMAPKNVSERNLGICWHEVAGHAIATARRRHREKLVKWTTTLQERLQTAGYWGHYSELYQQSILDNLCGRAKYEKAGILPKIDKIIREDIFEKNPITVDGDGDWQITWLLELLEDWFWILVGKEGNMPGELADGVTTVLADALAKTYENLRVGDPNHPPPHLRILVGINYLCNGDQECIDQRIDRFVGGGEDIFGFTQAGPDRELSAVIASVCQEILDEQGDNPWLYQTEVTDQERNIAAKILNGQPLSLNELLDPDQEGILAADPDIIDQINTAEDLESLLAIDFTTDDFFPLGGATPWPPQRFGFR